MLTVWCTTLSKRTLFHPNLLSPIFRCYARSYSATPAGEREPLKILYCGSDKFSRSSLDALNKFRLERPDVVSQIEVVHKPEQLIGRNKSWVYKAPIQELAEELNLERHPLESFEGWKSPEGINLIIAVSYGLFIPKEILDASKYGGLNVHPSLLPDLRGASPLHHTLLYQRSHTGVTIQTLDKFAFDKGTRLLQTDPIPVNPNGTVDDLTEQLAPIAAEKLVQTILERRYEDPDTDRGHAPDFPRTLAPKLASVMGRVAWNEWTAEEIERRARALNFVWSTEILEDGKRLKMSAITIAKEGEQVPTQPGEVWYVPQKLRRSPNVRFQPTGHLLVGTCCGRGLKVQGWIPEGKPPGYRCKEFAEVGGAPTIIRRHATA